MMTPAGFDPIDGCVFSSLSDPSAWLMANALTPPPAPALPPKLGTWFTAYSRRPSADTHMPSQFRSSACAPVSLTFVSDPSPMFTLNTVTPPPVGGPGAAPAGAAAPKAPLALRPTY